MCFRAVMDGYRRYNGSGDPRCGKDANGKS
jgi:hypothetical protein